MSQQFIDFQRVDAIDAEAIGQPGRRVFRIRLRKGPETASLWLEKQQLQALCRAIRRVLGQHSSGGSATAASSLPMADFPAEATVDFRIGSLGLAWDEAAREIVLEIQPLEGGRDVPLFLRCRASPDQARAFCQQAEAVCAAGRPSCPLCGEPIDPDGHSCIRSNGHREQDIIEG